MAHRGENGGEREPSKKHLIQMHHLSRLISGYLPRKKMFHNKNFYNHLTSINCKIMRCNDGNVPIA